MSNILSISGKKQSGKNSAFNFLLGLELLKTAVVREQIEIDQKGKLHVSDLFGDTQFAGIFDIDRNTEPMNAFREEYIYPFIRNYSFADVLKRDVCMGVLGLSWEQCYGTDEQKMSHTHLFWENMPGVITPLCASGILCDASGDGSNPNHMIGWHGLECVIHEPGPMTAREVMQFVGTEIFRKMYGNVWADSTLKRIKDYSSHMSIITDCRFPNEVEATQKNGGKVIRLTRSPIDDNHHSETALDEDKFDHKRFDAIIDNRNLSIEETNGLIYTQLVKWGWADQLTL